MEGKEIIRGDSFAGGKIIKGKMMLWERWDVREIKDNTILIYPDGHILPELYNDKLVLLLPNPVFINFN